MIKRDTQSPRDSNQSNLQPAQWTETMERNYRDAGEVLNALVADMKIQDDANTTRHLDIPRLELKHRLNAKICETEVEKECREQSDLFEKYFNERDRTMQNLLDTAKDLLDNIRIENEIREHKRRALEMQKHEDLSAKIESAKIQTLAEFDHIIAKWTELNEVEDTFDLYQKFETQKQQIAEVMDCKQKMIELCQQESLRMNDEYFDNIEQQNSNFITLIERIKASVDLTNKVNAQALDDVSDMLYEEQLRHRNESLNKWNDFLDYTQEEEEKQHEILFNKSISYAEKFKETIKEHEDMTRMIRRQLDDQYDQLQIDLEEQRYSYLLNSEKLDYNLQILEKRNLEHLNVVNQQKRNVTRLMAQITRAKHRYASAQKSAEVEKSKLKNEIKILQQSIFHQNEKLHNLRLANKRNFDSMWNMNMDDAIKSCRNILAVEKTIHELMLMTEWKSPDLEQMNNIKPKANNKQVKEATRKKLQSRNIFLERRLHVRLVRKVLQQIADGAGVLVERKVLDILAPYAEKHKSLIRLENIFNVLHISNDDLLQSLIDFFKPYTWCPNCSNGLPDEVVKQLMNDSEQDFKNYVMPSNDTCTDHYFVTEPAFVLTILNKYLSKYLLKPTVKMILDDILAESPNLIMEDEKSISGFFKNFFSLFSENQAKRWKLFEHCLQHYLSILRKREALNAECEQLIKHNNEMKYFLKKYT